MPDQRWTAQAAAQGLGNETFGQQFVAGFRHFHIAGEFKAEDLFIEGFRSDHVRKYPEAVVIAEHGIGQGPDQIGAFVGIDAASVSGFGVTAERPVDFGHDCGQLPDRFGMCRLHVPGNHGQSSSPRSTVRQSPPTQTSPSASTSRVSTASRPISRPWLTR